MEIPEVKETIEKYNEHRNNYVLKNQIKEADSYLQMSLEIREECGKTPLTEEQKKIIEETQLLSHEDVRALLESFFPLTEEEKKSREERIKKLDAREAENNAKYKSYYPISDYSIIYKINKNTHPSYIAAATEVCEDILAHESEEDDCNIKFAKKFLGLQKEHIYTRDVSEDRGVLYTLEEWNEEISSGSIINYDGSGYWVKDNKVSDEEVFSSEPLDATHVIWFNK